MAKAALKHEVEGQLVLLAEELRSFAANARAGTWRKATHNLYYAAFDATAALLWSKGIEPKSHDGAQSMLALHFVKPGALPADTARGRAVLARALDRVRHEPFLDRSGRFVCGEDARAGGDDVVDG